MIRCQFRANQFPVHTFDVYWNLFAFFCVIKYQERLCNNYCRFQSSTCPLAQWQTLLAHIFMANKCNANAIARVMLSNINQKSTHRAEAQKNATKKKNKSDREAILSWAVNSDITWIFTICLRTRIHWNIFNECFGFIEISMLIELANSLSDNVWTFSFEMRVSSSVLF